MAGRMQYFQADVTQLKNFPILCFVYRKICFCFGSEHNRGTGCFREIEVTADEVCMEMGFKNILDGSFSLSFASCRYTSISRKGSITAALPSLSM